MHASMNSKLKVYFQVLSEFFENDFRHLFLYTHTPRHATLLPAAPHYATARYTMSRHITPRPVTPRHATLRRYPLHHATFAPIRYTTQRHATLRPDPLHQATSHQTTTLYTTPRDIWPATRYTTRRPYYPQPATPRHATLRHNPLHHATPHYANSISFCTLASSYAIPTRCVAWCSVAHVQYGVAGSGVCMKFPQFAVVIAWFVARK